MKIIFLDIDGVLNSVMYDAHRLEERADNRIDLTRVKLLADIVNATDAKIVLSSTWREDWDKTPELCGSDGEYLNRCLVEYGLSIIDKTPCFSYSDDRQYEIRAWLVYHDHEVESFVILDDINCGWGVLSSNVVVTNPYGYGLEESHVQKAIDILQRYQRSKV
jgi:hypothetical protein